MDICGKLRVFSHNKKEDTGLSFSTSIGRKLESGEYDNVSVSVFFCGDLKEKSQKLQANYSYELEDVIGFLSAFKGNLQVMITNARITGKKEFKVSSKKAESTKEEVKKPSKRKTVNEEANLDDLPF